MNNTGLTTEEAGARLKKYGPNQITAEKKITFIDIFWEEVREPMILLLLFTGFLYSLWGKLDDALTIIVVILILVGVEVYNEFRAKKTIAALRQLSEPTTAVWRDGKLLEVPAETVVPGDVLALQSGRRISADARLIEAFNLAADESSLTGESVPVEKSAAEPVYAGTAVTRGRGLAEAVKTGMATELGRIVSLTKAAKPPRTPLQLAMRELTRFLVWVALGFSTIVPLLGWLVAGQPLRQMLLTGLSLTFATIPEELPIIITMVLALGGYRLSKRNAVAKQLKTVETLGAVTVIATDKTGTLTQNRLEVSRVYPEAARKKIDDLGLELDVKAMKPEGVLINEFTFDNSRKRMSIVYRQEKDLLVAVKGAPEGVLDRCVLPAEERVRWLELASQMAKDGLRVIAFAEKPAEREDLTVEETESGLSLIGLVGFEDKPRPEVKAAIAACRAAGIRPIMVTGDHPNTASAIAEQVGLGGEATVVTGAELDRLSENELIDLVGKASIFARTTPEHKLRIVNALHRRGEVVAVTGDGVNDAPALAAADIGIAMGETGTDVAREAAGMVLADDNFATIVRAIEEGRVLFENLKKGVRYYLSCKAALISITLLPVLLRVPVPFAPIQIILMELFMDLAASATFAAEPAESDFMRLPPRDPKRPFMDRPMLTYLFVSAAGLFAAVTFNYLFTWYLTGDLLRAQTVAFASWLVGHVLLAVNMRSEREPISKLGWFSNPIMIGWAAAALAFVLASTLIPGVRQALKTVPLTGLEWLMIICVTAAGTFWLEAVKLISFGKNNK
ncbi:MAG: cation-transporting P-type ATPase [Candidatus Margulisbacteria bacterium]|nr:cation-transporting P-type ATPase [Candidatus Margulisiibacteriota bacterium]